MDYNEFREEILKELQKRHGDGMEIIVSKIKKNNGADYYGVRFQSQSAGKGITLGAVFRLDYLYEAYADGKMDIAACAEALWEKYEKNKEPEGLQQFVKDMRKWDSVKKNVYPVLLPMEGNADLLSELVKIPMLDLAVIFVIRGKISDSGCGTVKITTVMMEDYKVSSQELYAVAMENLRNDGYRFQSMTEVLRGLYPQAEEKISMEKEMYVLSNASGMYGAVGILNRELIRKFAEGRDFYILPSSVHEMIFIPASDEYIVSELDQMVEEINRTQVILEERLTDHCYFYDAEADEIRMEL